MTNMNHGKKILQSKFSEKSVITFLIIEQIPNQRTRNSTSTVYDIQSGSFSFSRDKSYICNEKRQIVRKPQRYGSSP